MKKLVFFAILLLSCQGVFAQKSDLSVNEIEEYSTSVNEIKEDKNEWKQLQKIL